MLLLVLVSGALAQEDSRIWSIAVGDDWGAHEYRFDLITLNVKVILRTEFPHVT